MRNNYKLEPEEIEQFNRLRPLQGEAVSFWKRVSIKRGLDYKTTLSNLDEPYTFTGMKIGHGKHWCYPSPIKCPKLPS